MYNQGMAQEKTLSLVVKDLVDAVNNLEVKIYGPAPKTANPGSVPPPSSVLRQNMILLEELTKRIRKASDQLPL